MKRIGIATPLESVARKNMLDTLGEALDVCFELRAFGNDTGLDAWVLPQASGAMLRRAWSCGLPCYAVVADGQPFDAGVRFAVDFRLHEAVPDVLRGRCLEAEGAAPRRSLPPGMAEAEELASAAGRPVWAVRQAGKIEHHYCSFPLPGLGLGEPLFRQLRGGRCAELAPFLHFLKSLHTGKGWEFPPLRACLMFDDPNLHWRTYGFIDFANMAAHARVHGYHVAFATIPLDGWYAHPSTALLFRGASDRLSLLIHGNDHVARELARPAAAEVTEAALRQALVRIGKLERRSGVEVARVMVPPHGACSERALAAMARLGIEAACISPGSLEAYNPGAAWVRTVGVRFADMIGGLAVFPRFGISDACGTDILVAALLGQPIIARGHHRDVSEGLDLLARTAQQVNALGAVRWASPLAISRMNYALRREGSVLRVRMFSPRVEVPTEEDVRTLIIERPGMNDAAAVPVVWRRGGAESPWRPAREREPAPVGPGMSVEIAADGRLAEASGGYGKVGARLWPILRRQMTEARDRLAPFVRRITAFSHTRGTTGQ